MSDVSSTGMRKYRADDLTNIFIFTYALKGEKTVLDGR